MIELALRTYLLGKQPITALVGSRIYIGEFVPLSKADLPAIVFEADPTDRLEQIDGQEVPLQFPLFDVVVKSLSFDTSIGIANLIKQAFRSIRLGGIVNTAPGRVRMVSGSATLVGDGTAWDASAIGQTITLRDHLCQVVYQGTVISFTSPTSIAVSPTPAAGFSSLTYDLNGATAAVQLTQVDNLGSWNEDEADEGHSITSKSHVVKIRVGWFDDVSAI